MKVLMSAYACEPGKSSEPAVGWNWALQAARRHDVWVVTRENNRTSIEAYMANDPQENLHFVYHDLPRWASFWKRGGKGLHLYYLLWQLSALRLARRLESEQHFDIGHHVTFVSYRFPSFLAWMKLPYVWGPLAGGESAPLAFNRGFGRRGTLQQLLRAASNRLVRFDPLVRRTARRASVVVAATPETAAAIGSLFGRISLQRLAIGWHGAVEANDLPPGPLRLIFVGRLVHWKGVHLGLRALAAALRISRGLRLTIVGDGPERVRLEKLAAELGIGASVSFTGSVSAGRVDELLGEHNCFIFPSFQDSGGFAVLEAMARGLPVLCLDSGGPARLVSNEAGLRVPALNPQQVVEELAAALIRLNGDESLRRRLGDAGSRRVAERFGWDSTGDFIDELYRCCLESEDAALAETLLTSAASGIDAR